MQQITSRMTSKYLHIVNPNEPCDSFPTERLATPFPFPLDPFQKHAIKAIHEGHNVLVTAKTGSGKTMVGEYLIHHCLKKGQRVFYTTPIKSLSNQKFHDLKQIFPSVGIMTGDIKYRPDAQVLIMTTEILRNLLYKDGTTTQQLGLTGQITLENLGGVVFDEVHYINDRERGKVWEETMILLKPEIQQVLLSATIDHPELFASWLADLKERDVYLLSTSYRIVPLIHQVLIGCGPGNPQPQLIMDNKEAFYEDTYKRWTDWRNSKAKEADMKKQMVRARGHDDPVVKGIGGMPSFTHQLNQCVQMLSVKDLLPALFFVFSRAGCERFAKLVEGSVITSSDTASIQHIWDFHLHKYKDVLEHLPQAHQLLALCKRGIAFHHSGLLPMLREIVEILFGKGLIKCLFATETFAVGINMPTKTVVFLDLEKYSDECQGLRPLRTDEYIQMAGRAGRRGKDTIGHVFYLPQRDPITLGQAKQMLTGKKSSIQSQMNFGYDFLLKTTQAKNLKWRDLVEKSYWNQQLLIELKQLTQNEKKLKESIDEFLWMENELDECQHRMMVEEKLKLAKNKALKEAKKELDVLLEKYREPIWNNKMAKYQRYTQLLTNYANTQREIQTLENQVNSLVEPRFQLLQQWGFLDNEMNLTALGMYATEINEGQQILMAKAYEEKVCETMNHEEFVGFLAAFLNEGKDKDDAPRLDDLKIGSSVKEALYLVDGWAAKCQKEEDTLLGAQKGEFWSLKTTWIEPLYRWTAGSEDPAFAATLCQEYGIYEGNFMRSILKVANILEEWINLATYTQNIEMLQFLEGLREKLVRDIAKPDSLYLKL